MAPFTPSKSDNACPTYYRGCWHVVGRGFLVPGTVIIFFPDRALHTEILRSRGVAAASGFPPLCNIPHKLLRRSLGRVSVPMAGRPLRLGLTGSSVWWAVTANCLIRRRPIPYHRVFTEPCSSVRCVVLAAVFQLLSPVWGARSPALLTRPPLSQSRINRRN